MCIRVPLQRPFYIAGATTQCAYPAPWHGIQNNYKEVFEYLKYQSVLGALKHNPLHLFYTQAKEYIKKSSRTHSEYSCFKAMNVSSESR
jgi:hypothetical protein